MGNFEKLGILVIIVLVVVILVLAVWGMGVPSDPQDGDMILSGEAARAGNGTDVREDPKTVPIPDAKESGGGLDRWLKPRDEPGVEPEPKIEPDPKDRPKDEPAPVAAGLTHKVVEGDKLWPLADRYYGNGKYWTVIRDANPGVDPGALPVGKTLKIPNPDTVLAKKGTAPRTGSSAAKSTAGSKTYTVRKNDTLSTIAARTLGSSTLWKKLYEANRKAIGSNPDDLRLGMILVIP